MQPIRRTWHNYWHLGDLTKHCLPYIHPHAYLRLAQQGQQRSPAQTAQAKTGRDHMSTAEKSRAQNAPAKNSPKQHAQAGGKRQETEKKTSLAHCTQAEGECDATHD